MCAAVAVEGAVVGGWLPSARAKHHHLRLADVDGEAVFAAKAVHGIEQGLECAGVLGQEDHVISIQQELQEGGALEKGDACLGRPLSQPGLDAVEKDIE